MNIDPKSNSAATEGCAPSAGYVAWHRDDPVKWWHHDRRGTKYFFGVIVGASARGPYYRVRRDDTGKVVSVRTTALRPHTHSPAPVRVQLSRKKGWRMPENTVKVSRPGKWGNPFKVGVDGDAKKCVELFGMDVCNPYNPRVGFDFDEIQQLRGKNLACWCKLGSPCHADVLIRLAND